MNKITSQRVKGYIKTYWLNRRGLLMIEDQLQEVKARLTSIKSVDTSTVPNFGGGSKREGSMIDLLCEKDDLEGRLTMVKKNIEKMEMALQAVEPKEREILIKLWGEGRRAESVAKDFHYSRQQIYRISDQAMEKLAVVFYGVV